MSGIEPGIANWALRHPPIELRNVFLKKYHLSLSASFGHSISLTDSHSQSISFSLYLSLSLSISHRLLIKLQKYSEAKTFGNGSEDRCNQFQSQSCILLRRIRGRERDWRDQSCKSLFMRHLLPEKLTMS